MLCIPASTMSYAKALSTKKSQTASEQTRVYAYAHAKGALWGDINDYHPAVDGDYKTFFEQSAAKRIRWREEAEQENIRTPQQVLNDQERVREKSDRREQLLKQSRAKNLLSQWVRIKVRVIRHRVSQRASRFTHLNKCKCGCGRLEHSKPPRSEVVGFCCAWCAKHGGRKGHGDACEAISSTTFLRLS
jgi:hypothetical protein